MFVRSRYLNTMMGPGWKMDHSPFMLCGGEVFLSLSLSVSLSLSPLPPSLSL